MDEQTDETQEVKTQQKKSRNPSEANQPIIETPNIDDPKKLDQWLDRYVQKPFLGYEDKKHPNGTPYSFDDQVEASKDQLRSMAKEMPDMGAKKEVVASNLKSWVVGLQKEADEI